MHTKPEGSEETKRVADYVVVGWKLQVIYGMEMQADLLNVKESNSGEKVRCSAINKERSMVERQECWWLKEVGSMFGSDEKGPAAGRQDRTKISNYYQS